MSTRYALYFAPESSSPLARFGEKVLGRTALQARRDDVDSPFPDRDRWLALTTSPAHYGFHATLKAPFELADDHSPEELISRVEKFASSQRAVPLPGLLPRALAGFTALTLEHQPPALQRLAMSVVETFEPFRRALSARDIERRKQQRLSPRQLELLERFGYPYVDEEFRFHMTLSGTFGNRDADYLDWLRDHYRQMVIDTPYLDQLAIYSQTERSAPFIRQHSFPLSAG